jgi:general secretion pathway protein G
MKKLNIKRILFYKNSKGISLVELLVTVSLILILTMAVMPIAKFTIKREKEAELRRALRMMRDAIDRYHDMAMPPNGGPPLIGPIKYGSEGYPPNLETLVEGASLVNSTKKVKFLRRIPVDPMTGSTDWGLRCYTDEPNSEFWCGENVYDVYSKSKEKALDGTHYNEW